MLHELEHKAMKELERIGEQGFTSSNLEAAYKLIDIVKDIKEVEGKDGGDYGRYMGGMYNGYRENRDSYRADSYSNYRGTNDRMNRNIDRIREGVDMYWYGREKYNAGGNKEQMYESLENMMYAICSLIESGMDIAETPEEKEIIRKHIRKLQSL